jgi:hypothetical protein
MLSSARLHAVGVAGDKSDLFGIDPQPFADDLGKAGFMTRLGRDRGSAWSLEVEMRPWVETF